MSRDLREVLVIPAALCLVHSVRLAARGDSLADFAFAIFLGTLGLFFLKRYLSEAR